MGFEKKNYHSMKFDKKGKKSWIVVKMSIFKRNIVEWLKGHFKHSNEISVPFVQLNQWKVLDQKENLKKILSLAKENMTKVSDFICECSVE